MQFNVSFICCNLIVLFIDSSNWPLYLPYRVFRWGTYLIWIRRDGMRQEKIKKVAIQRDHFSTTFHFSINIIKNMFTNLFCISFPPPQKGTLTDAGDGGGNKSQKQRVCAIYVFPPEGNLDWCRALFWETLSIFRYILYCIIFSIFYIIWKLYSFHKNIFYTFQ